MDLRDITTYQAGAKQASVNRSLQKLCDALLQPFNITKTQWFILGYVLDAGQAGVRVSDLAGSLSTTVPYITSAINILEERGWLERRHNDEDSRSRLLVLNPDCVQRCADIETVLRQGLRQSLYADIDPAEFRIYMKVMYQIDGASRQAVDRLAT